MEAKAKKDEPIVLSPHDAFVYETQRHLEKLSMDPRTTDKHYVAAFNKINEGLNQWPHSRGLQYLLGTLALFMGNSGLAISLLRYCMTPQTEKEGSIVRAPNAWNNLAGAYKAEHDDEMAEECYMRSVACALNENGENKATELANAYHGIASLYINRGMPERVMHWAEKALAHNPEDRFALWNKGLAHLELGEFGPGFDLYDRAGFMEGQGKPRDRKLKEYGGKLQKWEGQRGVTVVCYGEQGVGDEIMFFSMLPDLMKDCKVIIECDPRIEGILKVSFPGVPIYPTSGIDDPYDWLKNHPECTHYIACGSLGKFYRRKREDFPGTPYLKAEPWLVDKWAEIMKDVPRPRIGLSWAGGLKKTRMDKRSLALPMLKPILDQDATFFSLQYHPIAADHCAQYGTDINKPIFHWGDVVGGPGSGYSDTAAFLSQLDLVVTVNTSLVHLCGSLGVPTLCLTPTMRAWRYGGKSGPSYWYNSVEQINQTKEGHWESVIAEAARRVKALVDKTKLDETQEAA